MCTGFSGKVFCLTFLLLSISYRYDTITDVTAVIKWLLIWIFFSLSSLKIKFYNLEATELFQATMYLCAQLKYKMMFMKYCEDSQLYSHLKFHGISFSLPASHQFMPLFWVQHLMLERNETSKCFHSEFATLIASTNYYLLKFS